MNTPAQKKRKIEVLVDHFYPATGGLAIHCLRIYEILVQRGWDVAVRTTMDTTDERNVLGPYELVAGISVRRYPHASYRLNPFVFRIDYGTCDVICLNELIVLPHYFTYAYLYVLKLLGRRRPAVVLTSHGLFTTDISAYSSVKRRLKRAIDRTLGVFFINNVVDRVHAIAGVEAGGLVAAGVDPSLVEVIPNGLDDDAFKDIELLASPEIRDEFNGYGTYLLQVGRLDRHKNYEGAIRVLSLLPENIRYIILGPPEDAGYRAELDALIRELHLEGRVIFRSVIRGVDKYYVMAHALAYVHLAHSEGFGMVVLEAMSQGVPCIVSAGTALEELVKDGVNGYVFPRGDAKAIALRVRAMIDNPHSTELLKIKKNNISFAAGRTWAETAASMDALFRKAIGHSRLQQSGRAAG